jgi:hypothetical protein
MSWYCVLCCAHVMVLCFVLCTCHGIVFCAVHMSWYCALCCAHVMVLCFVLCTCHGLVFCAVHMSWYCVLCCAHVMVLCFVLCTCHGFGFCAVYKALSLSKLCALCFCTRHGPACSDRESVDFFDFVFTRYLGITKNHIKPMGQHLIIFSIVNPCIFLTLFLLA